MSFEIEHRSLGATARPDPRPARWPAQVHASSGGSTGELTPVGATADQPIACSVDLGRAIYDAQAHAGVGGEGTGTCSGDLLLGALAACARSPARWCEAMGQTLLGPPAVSTTWS